MKESAPLENADPDTLAREARRRGFDDWERWALETCPLGDWPGRDMVDLDNVGDPGSWLKVNLRFEDVFSAPAEVDIEEIAEVLAAEYITAHEKLWGESYSYHVDTAESYQEFLAGIVNEFKSFIHEWQKRLWRAFANRH